MKSKRRTKAAIKADRIWQARMILLLIELGAVRNEAYVYLDEYLLETTVGTLKLSVFPCDRFVAGRFVDVPRAVARLGSHAMNQYSGKWNHHHSDLDTEASLKLIADALTSKSLLLPT